MQVLHDGAVDRARGVPKNVNICEYLNTFFLYSSFSEYFFLKYYSQKREYKEKVFTYSHIFISSLGGHVSGPVPFPPVQSDPRHPIKGGSHAAFVRACMGSLRVHG